MWSDRLRGLQNPTATPALAEASEPASDLMVWSPLTFVVDPDTASTEHASAIMARSGVENLILADSHALAHAMSARVPDLIVLDMPADGTDAIDSILMLGERNFAGAVQLTSQPGTVAIDTVRHLGKR